MFMQGGNRPWCVAPAGPSLVRRSAGHPMPPASR